MLTEPVMTVEAFAEAVEPPALQVAAEPRFDFRGAEYGRLFESSDATALQHPLWLDGLYRNLAPPLGDTARDHPPRRGVRPACGRPPPGPPQTRPASHGGVRRLRAHRLRRAGLRPPRVEPADGPTASGAMLRALRPFDLLRTAKLREDGLDLRPLLGSASQSVMPAAAHDVRGTRLQAVGPR